MNKTNPKVDGYIKKSNQWQEETKKLRSIILDCGLTEELKWGKPCYTFQESNIVVIQGFKQYCALLFFKGILLKDPNNILIKTGDNTRVGRQIRFTNAQQIVEPVLKAYINQAIEVEKAGLKVPLQKTSESKIPGEFQTRLDKLPSLKKAFAALTPGRQRAYLFYFSGAKQSKTRAARIEKVMPQILNGKGLNDE